MSDKPFIHHYLLTELDRALDQGPITVMEADTSAISTLTKKVRATTTCYEIARYYRQEWQSSIWGKTLDEVLLNAVFGAGRIMPSVVDERPVVPLIGNPSER